jgi:hypothetical protein
MELTQDLEIAKENLGMMKQEAQVKKPELPKLKDLTISEIPLYYGSHPKVELMIMDKSISSGSFNDEEKRLAQRALVYSMGGENVPPKYRNNPMGCFVVLMQGNQLGLTDMQAMANITLINGVPCLWGTARLSLIMASGLCTHYKVVYFDEKYKEISLDNGNLDSPVFGCKVEMKRGGLESSEVFTRLDAEKGGLLAKSGFAWKNWTRDMLKHRASHRVEDTLFPDVLCGMGSAESAMDANIGTEKKTINLDNVENFE